MIDKTHCYQKNGETYLTDAYFHYLRENKLLVDITEGGLLWADTYPKAGVSIVFITRDLDILFWQHKPGRPGPENGSFFINVFALQKNESNLIDMFAGWQPHHDRSVTPYPITDNITTFNVSPRKLNGELITPLLVCRVNGFGIIPPSLVKVNLKHLNTLNLQAWQTEVIDKDLKHKVSDIAVLARHGMPRSLN